MQISNQIGRGVGGRQEKCALGLSCLHFENVCHSILWGFTSFPTLTPKPPLSSKSGIWLERKVEAQLLFCGKDCSAGCGGVDKAGAGVPEGQLVPSCCSTLGIGAFLKELASPTSSPRGLEQTVCSKALLSVKGKEVVLVLLCCFVRKDVRYPDVVILLITNGLYLGKVATPGRGGVQVTCGIPGLHSLPCPSSPPLSLPQRLGPFSSLSLGNPHPPPALGVPSSGCPPVPAGGWMPLSAADVLLGSLWAFPSFLVCFCLPLWNAFVSCSYTCV